MTILAIKVICLTTIILRVSRDDLEVGIDINLFYSALNLNHFSSNMGATS